MCINFKKICLWTEVNRKIEKTVGLFVGDRSSKSFAKLCQNIFHIEAKLYDIDKLLAYDVVPKNKHLISKSHTYTVKLMYTVFFVIVLHVSLVKLIAGLQSWTMIDRSVILLFYLQFVF